MPPELVIVDEKDEFLYSKLVAGDLVSERFFHLGHRRDWRLHDVRLSATAVRRDEDHLTISLKSDGYAHFVFVSVDDSMARYSDNFFDLLAGEAREIVVRTRRDGPITIRSANAEEIAISIA
jgi:hypothetical protein